MSGIYIPGMEMPTSCHECVAGYGGCCYVAPADADGICPDHGRADFCPLVPVPDHGRLIDADKLDYSKTDLLGNHIVYMVDIEDAPTIIPADPDKEGEG